MHTLYAQRSGKYARYKMTSHIRALRRRRQMLDAMQAEAKRVLGPELYKRVRRHSLIARHTWEESDTVYRAALGRLFYIARLEIAHGKWTPPQEVATA